MRLSLFNLVTVFFLLAMLAGCSGQGDVPSSPENGITPQDEGDSLPPVHFTMNFDPEDWSVTVHKTEHQRVGLIDVTPWADIFIYKAQWVPSERNWYVSAQIKNTTQFKGYGVWVVFTELGEKELRDIDGFIYYGPEEKRVPLIALRKEAPLREFPGYHVEDHTFVIHWPVGVNSWAPVNFYVDASWPKPRNRPMVEDLEQGNFPPPCYHYAIRAHVQDFQSPSADLTVWADISSYGDTDHLDMFDDGEHADDDPDDGIFGGEFDPGSIFGTYTFTVYARDPEGHGMENDLFFAPIEFPPLPPIQWETIAQGTQSGIHEERFEVIKDESSWGTFWEEHTSNIFPPPPIPEVDFDAHMVAVVMLGMKPNSCYATAITNVDYSSKNCGIMVYYDDLVPDPDCECFDVVNYPFHFITLPQSGWKVGFEGKQVIVDCCLDWQEVEKGSHCNIEQPGEWVIYNEAALDSFWTQLHGPAAIPPKVDFETEMVLAFTWGNKPSSGYYIELHDLCFNAADELEIDYSRMIPGASCKVLWVITTPYLVVRAERDLSTPVFLGADEVYECD